MTKPHPIEIKIINSTINGDVVAGDKTTTCEVHIHADQLTSTTSILEALSDLTKQTSIPEELLKKIAQDEELLKKLNDYRTQIDDKEVEQSVRDAIAEYERIGFTSEVSEKLHRLLARSQEKAQWISYSLIATLLIQILFKDQTYYEKHGRSIVRQIELIGTEKRHFGNIAIAYAYQATQNFMLYMRAIYDLHHSIMVYQQFPGQKLPPVNFLYENKQALGSFALAEHHISKALTLSAKFANPGAMIIVLNMLGFIQFNAFYLSHVVLRKDSSDQRDRVYHVYQIIDDINKKFGNPRDKAVVEMNLANFYSVQPDFEKASVLAYKAAQELIKGGYAFDASKALKIYDRAIKKESPFFSVQDIKLPEFMDAKQFENMILETTRGQMKIQGVDSSHPHYNAIEMALKDICPERAMKFCKHVSVEYDPSPLGESIALPSLGKKMIKCGKLEQSFGKLTGLDDTLHFFKSQIGCDSCQFREPRAPEWQWRVSMDGSVLD